MRVKIMFVFLLIICSFQLSCQTVYKTPHGTKYHLASCRMVENVSRKVVDPKNTDLSPCKFCNPPEKNKLKQSFTLKDKSSGVASTKQCKGVAKSTGQRCKHMTSIGNGYCFQHTSQNSSKTKISNKSSHFTSRCGARTKSGKACRRKVQGGGRCYQHK